MTNETEAIKKEEERFRNFLNNHKAWYRTTKEIHSLFTKEFNKDKRTLQRWRKNLILKVRMYEDSNTKYREALQRVKECYFCESKQDLLIHHLNEDRNDNREENLLTLCPKCHHRLHEVLKRLRHLNA